MLSTSKIHEKIEQGVPTVLRNTKGTSDKFYIFWLKKPKDEVWTLFLHYGRVDSPGIFRCLSSKTIGAWNKTYDDLYSESYKLLKEKTNKGYSYLGEDPYVVVSQKNCPVLYPTKVIKDEKPTATSDYDDVLL